jgi:uncharacterized protein (DUF2147 family)
LTKTFALAIAAGLAAMFPATSQAADPTVAGLWQRVEKPPTWVLMLDRGNGMYEGVVAKTFPEPGKPDEEICTACSDDRKGQPILGISLIRDMKRKGMVYEGGNILDPRDGQVWKAMLTLSPDNQTMTLRGYLGVPMLGQDDAWKRLPDTAFAQVDPALLAKFAPERAAQLNGTQPPAAQTTGAKAAAVGKPKTTAPAPNPFPTPLPAQKPGTMAPAK